MPVSSPQSTLATLLDLVEELGIAVRRVPSAGDSDEHPGGAIVRLKGKEILMLDPTASLADQMSAAVAALRGRKEMEERFLTPEIRALLDAED